MQFRLIIQTLLSPALWATFAVALFVIVLFNLFTQTDVNQLQQQERSQWWSLTLKSHLPFIEQGLEGNNVLLLQSSLTGLASSSTLINGIELQAPSLPQGLVQGELKGIESNYLINDDASISIFIDPSLDQAIDEVFVKDSILLGIIAFLAAFGLIAWRKHQENRWWHNQQRLDLIDADTTSELMEHGSHLSRMQLYFERYQAPLRVGKQLQEQLPEALFRKITWQANHYANDPTGQKNALILTLALHSDCGQKRFNRAVDLVEKVAHLYEAQCYVQDHCYMVFDLCDDNSELEALLSAATLLRDMLCEADISNQICVIRDKISLLKGDEWQMQRFMRSQGFTLINSMLQLVAHGQIALDESLFNYYQNLDSDWQFEILRDLPTLQGDLVELWQLVDIPTSQQALVDNQSELLNGAHFAL